MTRNDVLRRLGYLMNMPDSTSHPPIARPPSAAWYGRDRTSGAVLQKILAHYADNFEMRSPVIAQVAGEPSGVIKGKGAVEAYWKKALALDRR